MAIIGGIIIIILMFAFGIIGVVFNLLKEIFSPRKQSQNKQNYSRKSPSQSRKKMIDKNEGEYVDFEEI